MHIRGPVSAIILLILVAGANSVSAQMPPIGAGIVGMPQVRQSITSVNGTPRYMITPFLFQYLNSFTSYEFPNPFPPNQDPLSRLEFPISQVFLGLKAEYLSDLWSLSISGSFNVSRGSGLLMQDSDWDDGENPGQKTIFSESDCRLNRGCLVDMAVDLRRPFENVLRFKPRIGWRYQYFYFTTHDGFQGDIEGNGIELDGDGIDFKQKFTHVYFGGSVDFSYNAEWIWEDLRQLRFTVDVDYGLVRGWNEDLHLLREGDRYTFERTNGHCWHIGLKAYCLSSLGLTGGLEFDFKRIITHGDHQLQNLAFDLDFSFGGSRVWSDQAFLGLFAEIPI